MKFHVPDMSCGHCTSAISKSIAATDPSAKVSTDLGTHMITVESAKSASDISAAIKAAGYEATPA